MLLRHLDANFWSQPRGWRSLGWETLPSPWKTSPSLIIPFLCLISSLLFCRVFIQGPILLGAVLRAAAPSAREKEREITGVGTVLLLSFFAFKVTFKENILVLTRIYLLYSCIWLLACVPSRQRSGPAQFKANEKGLFFGVCIFSLFPPPPFLLFFSFLLFLKQVIHW